MNKEPVYTFKKGEGWVFEHIESLEFSHSGKKLIIERRRPNRGEHYFTLWDKTEVNLSTFAKNIANGHFLPEDYMTWTEETEHLMRQVNESLVFVYREIT